MDARITLDLYFSAYQFAIFQRGDEALALSYEAVGGGSIKVTADIDAVSIRADTLAPEERSRARGFAVNVLVSRKPIQLDKS